MGRMIVESAPQVVNNSTIIPLLLAKFELRMSILMWPFRCDWGYNEAGVCLTSCARPMRRGVADEGWFPRKNGAHFERKPIDFRGVGGDRTVSANLLVLTSVEQPYASACCESALLVEATMSGAETTKGFRASNAMPLSSVLAWRST